MKHVFALLILLNICIGAIAQTTEEQYVRIYNLIQQGDGLINTGSSDQALQKFLEAQTALKRIQKLNPEWNPKVVNFRLNYLTDKIAAIPGAKTIAAPTVANVPATSTTNLPPVPPSSAQATPASQPQAKVESSDEAKQQMAALQEDVRRLQSEKTILEAKLKEAFSTQPAAIDPRELTKAQEKIQSLLKENELLKANLEQEQSKPASVNAKDLEETKHALAEAKQKIAEQSDAAEKFALVRTTLQERINNLTAGAQAAEALRAENELLKKQLAGTKTSAAPAGSPDETARKLSEAEARIATMLSDVEVLRLEKIALESRIKKVLASPQAKSAMVSREPDLQRIRQLEKERDEYQQKLLVATKEIQSGKNRDHTSKVEALTREVGNLRARVDVFEARAIPYSAEELALFKQSPPQINTNAPEPRRIIAKADAAPTTQLMAEARRNYTSGQFDKAEENFQELAKQDDKSVTALANLARVQIERNHFDEAEKNIRQALTISTNDGYSLFILGYMKYQQEKYDEALDALSRAAKIDPNNPEVQNCLGVTLNHKGLRGPAEQAFRKAASVDPNNASAHNNLAVFYATETPPNIPLARFHYQKAIAAGQPANPDIEKLFEKKEAATK